MNILVVGGGGREHAIVWKIAQSPKVHKIYCAPGNGGIAELAECVPIKATDIENMVEFAKNNNIDLCMVAPDDPLVLGMVDAMEEAGVRAFGPKKNAAILEGSKVFAKNLMLEHGIPTADYTVFDDSLMAVEYLRTSTYPTVIKAEGLALGKGVIIADNFNDAAEAVGSIMENKKFGAAGDRIVIERFLTGREVTVMAFTDGETIIPMLSSQDHKRACDGDKGLNTGGMGTYTPSPIYTPEIADYCMEFIFKPTISAMKAQGRKFKGILYFGLIITNEGVFVIEYNARFGDPETQVVLPLLKTDIVDIFEAIIDERLDEIKVEWDDRAAVCVILASGGYPGEYKSGYEITGLESVKEKDNIMIFHAGTKNIEGRVVTAGGRVLGVTGFGASLEEARQKAYDGAADINFIDVFYRKDIYKR